VLKVEIMMDLGMAEAGEWRHLHSLANAQSDPAVPGLGKMVGASPVMGELFSHLQRIAPTDVSVLITGESGTGKELVAETIHALSGRAEEPFIGVNCGAIPATLVEAELFGYEKGSFTGAIRSQAGYFERAGNGTLFLDETAEMPLDMQVKLLRALESRRIMRVGGEREIGVHARVIAATNASLSQAVTDNKLRPDLIYRLAVFHLELPALRDRGDDVELLAQYFLSRLNRTARTDKVLSLDSLRYLHDCTWPGNVRELYNTVQRSFILSDHELDLRSGVAYGPCIEGAASPAAGVTFKPGMSLAEVERAMIQETLQSCGGNKTRTAALLGISLKTLYNRLNAYRELE
jgi:DNA-binding NtrC family response regulator